MRGKRVTRGGEEDTDITTVAARGATLQGKGGYGLVGKDKAVCSETAALAVAKATGLPITSRRLGPVDVTPADFFDTEGVGKYFIVSPLKESDGARR